MLSPRRPGRPAAVLVLALAATLALGSTAAAQNPEGVTDTPPPTGTEPAPETPAGVSRKLKKKDKGPKQGKPSKEDKQRRAIETGARTAIDWYGEALQRYEAGRYLDARSILLPLEDSARAADIQERVKLLIADTYFKQGGTLNLAESLARYKSFLTFYPNSEHAEYAQFQLGRSYFKQLGPPDRDQSFTDSAIAEYQRLLDNYPDSRYADQARKDMLEAKALRARHEFLVAEFYWDWQDYTAAARRLQDVLRTRPELPERERALYMAAQSLYNLGRRDEAEAYAARLREDYPGTKYDSMLKTGGSVAPEKIAQREEKRDGSLERTYQRQLKQDKRRTRQIRKDSGLPGELPPDRAPAGAVAVGSTPAQAEAGAAVAATAGDGATSAEATMEGVAAGSAAPAATRQTEKEAKEAAEARERAARLEREEQEERAQREAREKERAEKQEREAAKAAEKREAEAAKAAAETPAQAKKREAREAKERAQAEKLEAEEQEDAARKAEREAKLQAERDAEAAKKAAKKARKKQ